MRALAILIAGAFAGCTCGTLSTEDLDNKYPYAEGTLFSRGGLVPVLQQLERAIGAPPQVTSVSIRPGAAYFTVRDPKRPGNLDNWNYSDRQWGDPQPVKTSRHDLEDSRSFALSEVPALGKLRDVIDKALAEVKIERGRVESVNVSRFKTIEISVEITGPRERGRVKFDAAGALLEKHVD